MAVEGGGDWDERHVAPQPVRAPHGRAQNQPSTENGRPYTLGLCRISQEWVGVAVYVCLDVPHASPPGVDVLHEEPCPSLVPRPVTGIAALDEREWAFFKGDDLEV